MNTSTLQLIAMLPADEGAVLLDMATLTKADPLLVVRRALALYQIKVLIEWMPEEGRMFTRLDCGGEMKAKMDAALRAKREESEGK